MKLLIKYKQAQHYMDTRYGGGELICCPDTPHKETRTGGRPDFLFRSQTGVLCALELSDLMPKKLKEVEAFINRNLVPEIENQLTGTFLLEIIVKTAGIKLVATSELDEVVNKIKRIAPKLIPEKEKEVIKPGYELSKIDDNGSRLHVWVLLDQEWFDTELPPKLTSDLQDQFLTALKEAAGAYANVIPCKFDEFAGCHRILIIDISHTPLDWDLHRSLIHEWLEIYKPNLLKLDKVEIADYNVWTGDGKPIKTGHKYENDSFRNYWLLWNRTN